MEENLQQKIDLVSAGARSPIALYALIVVVAVSGLITAVTLLNPGFAQDASIITIAVILVMIVYLVGTRALGKTVEIKKNYPTHGEKISQMARKGWYSGADASKLEGVWEIRWYEGDDIGKRTPYMLNESEEYPPEQALIKSEGAMISIESSDRTTGYIYFFEGRLSPKNNVTLTYWSQPDVNESVLVGVLFMQLEDSFDETVMQGEWIGYDRKGVIAQGHTHWKRISRNTPGKSYG